MNKMIKRIAAACIAVCSFGTAPAQDVHFSQFYETSVLRNPALAGIFTGEYKVGVMYRSQWSSISAPFQTGMLTAETRIPLNKDFLSIGLVAYYDKAGTINLQTTSVCPAVNYNKSLEDEHQSFLSVGFMGGYLQRSFDASKVTVDDQYQGGFNPDNATNENLTNSKIAQWDLGAGISFSSTLGDNNNTSYYVGIAGYHLTKPRASFFTEDVMNLSMKWSANAGLGIKLNDVWRAQLHGNYLVQGKSTEIILGGLLSWNKMDDREEHTLFSLHGGLFYRFGDALIPTMKLDIHDYTFGASYDLNMSTLKAATNLRGGFELSVFKTGLFKSSRFENARTACPRIY